MVEATCIVCCCACGSAEDGGVAGGSLGVSWARHSNRRRAGRQAKANVKMMRDKCREKWGENILILRQETSRSSCHSDKERENKAAPQEPTTLVGDDHRAVARGHQFSLFIPHHQADQIGAWLHVKTGFYGDAGTVEALEC